MTQDERQLRGYFKWWGIACLIVIVLNLLGCATATPIIATTFENPFQAGQTLCDQSNKPVIFIDARRLDNPQMKYVVLHEQHHAKQLRGDCNAIVKRYHEDHDFAVSQELEAYCVDMMARLRDDNSLVKAELVDRLATALVSLYFPTLSVAEVKQKLPCK